jgi:type III restriction enzyme
MSDFSLMDAIECGIVKLPRFPVSDNISTEEVPVFCNLWENIRGHMPKKSKAHAGRLDPQRLPRPLKTALDALYGHYKDTFELWEQAGIESPPSCGHRTTGSLSPVQYERHGTMSRTPATRIASIATLRLRR